MASLTKRLRAHYQDIYERAKRGLPKNPDGSLIEDGLQEAIAGLLPKVDPDQAARAKAKQIIELLTKQPGDDDDDDDGKGGVQLELFGDVFKINPLRLIRDAGGNIIEEKDAPLSFMVADMARSSQNLARVSLWNSRKAFMVQHMQRWVEVERANGRTPRELTWGNCMRETGILRS